MNSIHAKKVFSIKMLLLVNIFLFDRVIASQSSAPLSDHGLGTPNKLSNNDQSQDNENNSTKSAEIGPCQICRYTVKSFISTYRMIGRRFVHQGKAKWTGDLLQLNDQKLEREFYDQIRTSMCGDLIVAKDQCKILFKIQHDFLFKKLKEAMSQENQKLIADDLSKQIIDQLCINHMNVCCPDKHFGLKCRACPASTDGLVCNGNGQCKGEGTRKGSGKCVCSAGYVGDLCDSCANEYFLIKTNDQTNLSKPVQLQTKKITCMACDASCDGGCTAAGPKSCHACRKGYVVDPDYGCLDINECLEQEHLCEKGTFCVNTEGSHFCYECDKACESCHGDGPDMCIRCAENYKLENGVCVNTIPPKQESHMEMSRYFTYVGLCLATCIIFHNNIFIASVIGVIVATYIGIAEYTIGGASVQSMNELLKNFLR